jgi:heme/copper-type cytochrome/quinol oxidase subunit 3
VNGKPIATTRSVMHVPTGRLAVWWVLASEIVIFGGLLGAYIMQRLRHDAWADQAAHTNTWAGAFNTLVLLTSSLSAVLAHQAAEQGNGKKAAKLLRYTILGGGIFLVVKALASSSWSRPSSGPTRSSSATRSPRTSSGPSTTRRPACTRPTSSQAW